MDFNIESDYLYDFQMVQSVNSFAVGFVERIMTYEIVNECE